MFKAVTIWNINRDEINNDIEELNLDSDFVVWYIASHLGCYFSNIVTNYRLSAIAVTESQTWNSAK